MKYSQLEISGVLLITALLFGCAIAQPVENIDIDNPIAIKYISCGNKAIVNVSVDDIEDYSEYSCLELEEELEESEENYDTAYERQDERHRREQGIRIGAFLLSGWLGCLIKGDDERNIKEFVESAREIRVIKEEQDERC